MAESLFSRLQKLNKEPRHFTASEYREAADYVVENEDTATAANMLRCAADDVATLTGDVPAILTDSLPAVLNLIEAAQKTVENLAGDAYLYAIDELDAAAFMKALADTRDELEAAVAVFVSGQEEPK